MAKVTDPHSALFLDPIDKKYAILFVTRRDYQDKTKNLQPLLKHSRTQNKHKTFWIKTLVKVCGFKAGNKENDDGEFWITS